MTWFRETKVAGIAKASHRSDCKCEQCGPLLLLALSEYEATRLQEALETRNGRDTGDWHAQLRFKLSEALGAWNPPETNSNQ